MDQNIFHGQNVHDVQLMSYSRLVHTTRVMATHGLSMLIQVHQHMGSKRSWKCSGKDRTHSKSSPSVIGLADHADCHTSRGPICVAVKLALAQHIQQAAVTLMASYSSLQHQLQLHSSSIRGCWPLFACCAHETPTTTVWAKKQRNAGGMAKATDAMYDAGIIHDYMIGRPVNWTGLSCSAASTYSGCPSRRRVAEQKMLNKLAHAPLRACQAASAGSTCMLMTALDW